MLKRLLSLGCVFVFVMAACGMAYADDVQFASVHLDQPAGWVQKDTQMFSGASPSQAWIFAKGTEEVVFGAFVTEGVSSGLVDLATTILIRSYLEAFAISWGATVKGPEEGELAAYCGGQAGYHLEAKFGNDTYDYFGCMLVREDKWRAASLVTWVKRDDSPDPEGRALVTATKRFAPFLSAIYFDPATK